MSVRARTKKKKLGRREEKKTEERDNGNENTWPRVEEDAWGKEEASVRNLEKMGKRTGDIENHWMSVGTYRGRRCLG